MGTLFNQSIRKEFKVTDIQMYDMLSEAKRVANQHDLTVDQVLLAFKIKQLERKNDLMVSNGNIHDEQMAGIGNLLSIISSALESIAQKMEDKG